MTRRVFSDAAGPRRHFGDISAGKTVLNFLPVWGCPVLPRRDTKDTSLRRHLAFGSDLKNKETNQTRR
jgi:hypothetical protein